MDSTPLTLTNLSLPVPVELVAYSPGRLILKSHWSAPFRFLGAAPFSYRSFGVFAAVTVGAVGAVVYFVGKAVVWNRWFAISLFVAAVVGAVRTFLYVMLSWTAMRWRRGSPVLFDRDKYQVVFGPGTGYVTVPLGSAVALQLLRATAGAVGGDVWRALTADRSVIAFPLRWPGGSPRVYQLNLALADGSRLNLVNWRHWAESEQTLTAQLADFLRVPMDEP